MDHNEINNKNGNLFHTNGHSCLLPKGYDSSRLVGPDEHSTTAQPSRSSQNHESDQKSEMTQILQQESHKFLGKQKQFYLEHELQQTEIDFKQQLNENPVIKKENLKKCYQQQQLEFKKEISKQQERMKEKLAKLHKIRPSKHEEVSPKPEQPQIKMEIPDSPTIEELFDGEAFDECLKKLEISLKVDPWNDHHLILKTMCWIMLDNSEEDVLMVLDKILNVNPSLHLAYYAKAMKFYRDAKFKDCLDQLQIAIELNLEKKGMRRADIMKSRAEKLLVVFNETSNTIELGLFQEALKSLEKVDDIDPITPKIRQKVKDLQNYIWNEMKSELESEIDQEVPSLLQLEEKLKRIEEILDRGLVYVAKRKFREICEHSPCSPNLNWIRGYIFYMLGKLDEAIPILNNFYSTNRNHQKCRNVLEKANRYNEMLQTCFKLSTEPDRSLEMLDIFSRLTKIDETNKKLTQAAYLQRAIIKFKLGDISDAMVDMKIFIEIKKQSEVGLHDDRF